MDRQLPTRRTILVAVVALVVVAAALGAGRAASLWRADTRPALTAALASLPSDTTVVGFTSWRRLRAGPVPLGEARGRDLTTRSILADSRPAMATSLGWDVDDLDWEVYGQTPGSAVGVAGVRSRLDWSAVRAAMADTGYSGTQDRWSIGSGELRRAGVSDVLAEVALLPDHDLIVVSDRAQAVDAAVDVVEGRDRSLLSVRAAASTAQALSGADAVLLQSGPLACEAAAVPAGDAARQAQAAQERVGELAEPEFAGRAITDRGGTGSAAQQLRFALTFDSTAVARRQAAVRSALATGPFIGRTGTVEETLRLTSTSVRGSTVLLTAAHDPQTGVFMVGTGPLLFAAC